MPKIPITPPGTISCVASVSIASGWLPCSGQTVLRATYPGLFAAISTVWNTGGELITEFRLPNGVGRSLIGSGSYTDPISGPLVRTIGTYLGAEKHLLTGAESGAAPHNHPLSDPGHSHTFAILNQIANGNNPYTATGGQVGTGTTSAVGTGISVGASSAVNAASTHNNMQPSFVGNWIIKT